MALTRVDVFGMNASKKNLRHSALYDRNADHSIFLKYDKDGNLICAVGIYVDNIILASDSLEEIENTKRNSVKLSND